MKYLLLPLILLLCSCSFSKDTTFWNEDPIKDDIEAKKLSKLLKEKADYKTMTFDEFNLYLKDYSNKTKYPDINN